MNEPLPVTPLPRPPELGVGPVLAAAVRWLVRRAGRWLRGMRLPLSRAADPGRG